MEFLNTVQEGIFRVYLGTHVDVRSQQSLCHCVSALSQACIFAQCPLPAKSVTMADEKNIASSSGSQLGADEKNIVNLSESQLSRSDDEGQEITWTEEEEKALVRR